MEMEFPNQKFHFEWKFNDPKCLEMEWKLEMGFQSNFQTMANSCQNAWFETENPLIKSFNTQLGCRDHFSTHQFLCQKDVNSKFRHTE